MIFQNIILNIIESGKKVLYLWNGDGENTELVKKLKLEKKDLTHGYKKEDVDINFINYNDFSIEDAAAIAEKILFAE